MKHKALFPASLVLIVLLGACASQERKTLGSLGQQAEPASASASETADQVAPTASRQDVRAEYQELLELIDDQRLQEQIQRRIADVHMLEGEENRQTLKPSQSYYLDAIKSYRDILEKYPNSPDNAEVLYQLAKAYDMEGDQDEALAMLQELTERHPNHPNITEAYFRKGDILFNRGAYPAAEDAYRAVTLHGDSNLNLNLNANYMLGWSLYKQFHPRQALDSYVHVLNHLLGPVDELEQLSKANQSLAKDTLHSVSLSLDKLGGAQGIESLGALRNQAYVWMVYDQLSQYYLEKELFEASAETYRRFVEQHRDDDRTPVLHQKMIETYLAGSFPRQAFAEKENFVNAYGIYSGYARRRGGIVEWVQPSIRAYLDELARNYHARGQELQKELQEETQNQQNRQATNPDRAEAQADKLKETDKEAVAALDKAANFYRQFMETFPDSDQADEYDFRRSEALFAARRYAQSIAGYERVAYESSSNTAEEYGANAGYAAIVAHENHISTLDGSQAEKVRQWRGKAVDSMLRFVEKYHHDARSVSVLDKAAEHMFDLEQYSRALQVASSLLDNKSDLAPSLKRVAYASKAHSLFQLERFAEASDSYLEQRRLLETTSDDYEKVTERLARAIYRYSETLIAQDQQATAIEQLLRLKTLAPDSPVRITAQHDAATLLIEAQQWSPAIAELQELKQAYPDHQLAAEFPRKLAIAYEKSAAWKLAAEEFKLLSETDPDPELRREALYRAATLYEKDNDYMAAIDTLKAYNQRYPEPFSTRMEARYKLVAHYAQIGDGEKRRFWLQALVDGNREAGDQRNQRSRWLAAWANTEYGDHYAALFQREKLSLPLADSIEDKNERLEQATRRYEMASDSGLFEFVTMGAYKIAKLYQNFATELRESPRPEGLSEDEKALYAEILEEQAEPFEAVAMDLHRGNIERAWDGEFDPWISQSFEMMKQLQPVRFGKTELIVSYADEIR